MPIRKAKKQKSDHIHGQEKLHEDHHDDSSMLVIGGRDEIFEHNKKHKQLTKIILVRH